MLNEQYKFEIKSLLNAIDNISLYSHSKCNCYECVTKRVKRSGILDKVKSIYIRLYGYIPEYFYEHSEYYQDNISILLQNIVLKLHELLVDETNNQVCRICGTLSDTKPIKNSHYCQSCIDKYLHVCDECHEIKATQTLYQYIVTEKDGHQRYMKLCDNCRTFYTTRCRSCGSYTHKDNLNGSYTNIYGHLQQTNSKNTDYYYCKSCLKHHLPTHKCAECTALIFNGSKLCKKCDIFSSVHDYNYKPVVEYFSQYSNSINSENNKLYFGVELEYENIEEKYDRESAYTQIKSVWKPPFIYAKHDGSLLSGYMGVELVSMPFTYNHFTKNLKIWESMLNKVQVCGFEGDGMHKAGCHIHISNNMFTTFHRYKFTKFIYKQSTRPFMLFMSNRINTNASHYWSFDKTHIGDEKLLAKNKRNTLLDSNHTFRRTAANVTLNTIELRIFQSTTKIDILAAYVEFCDALFHFTKDTPPKDCIVSKFCQYIIQNKNKYRFLYNYIKTHQDLLQNSYKFISKLFN